MKALITGANGFIGSHIVRAALAEGMEVRAFVRKGSDMRNLAGLDVEKAHGDIRDTASLRRALKGCGMVFHTAALYAFGASDDRTFYDINVLGTRAVLTEAMARGVDRVVYTSTVGAVGANADGRPATEDTVWNFGPAGDIYTTTKYVAEMEALRLAVRGCPVVIVNPGAPVGEGDIRPTPTGQLVVSFMKGLRFGYVDSGISIADVEDVGRGHVLAGRKGRIGERYILGGENLTVSELFTLLARVTGTWTAPIRFPLVMAGAGALLLDTTFRTLGKTPPITPAAVALARFKLFYDSAKAKKELGYTVSPVEKALEKAVGWFRAHGYA